LLALFAAIGALLPWFVFAFALRGTIRRYRPRRIARSGRLPISRPGEPFGAAVMLVLLLAVVVAWVAFTRPLWQGFVLDAIDYRGNAAGIANEVSAELMATGQQLAGARIGHGRFEYSLGPQAETTRAVVSYYWRGGEDAYVPQPSDPVEMRQRDGPAGKLFLVYRRDLTAQQLAPALAAFDKINLDPGATGRRPGADVPLLLRSARLYWSPDFAGYLDNPAGYARFLAGLPVLPALYLAGLIIGLVP
jgi:hypothetical protein